MERNQNVALITEFEASLINKLKGARMRCYSRGKSFIRDIDIERSKLSDRGRWMLASLLQLYRRQYTLNAEQQGWVNDWLSRELNPSVSVPMEPNGPQGRTVPLPDTREAEQLSSSVPSGWLFSGDQQECAAESTDRSSGDRG